MEKGGFETASEKNGLWSRKDKTHRSRMRREKNLYGILSCDEDKLCPMWSHLKWIKNESDEENEWRKVRR